ncbi:PspA/IM30 family protein [Flexibacterium corallicola]|uniref:PspA/IM30 family protein n=1 Tax=Flexibacterium corallicola TaxID=3037259 RepID=UPI00286F18C1|nr:PspA/IM30 family protein [Pseudovibrio sp. M1P-2-3]
MSETLFRRVSRLVSGTANSIVDAVENRAPDVVMSEAIREIEGAIQDARTALGKVAVRKHVASQRLSEFNTRHEELLEQVNVALGKGERELAHAGVASQMDIEAQIPVLEKTIQDAGDEEQELGNSVKALQARKREMNEQLQHFKQIQSAQQHGTLGPAEAAGAQGVDTKVAAANTAFDRALLASTGVASPATAATAAKAGKLSELDELNRAHRIEERLAALNAALPTGGGS